QNLVIKNVLEEEGVDLSSITELLENAKLIY
ncbi:hypothetical protein AAUPMC_00675, partial [Pasteurella multocida subsp. multocida str. Anand1_cattle]